MDAWPPPPAPPHGDDDSSAATWCDPANVDARGDELEGPCLHGLPWWAWLLLIGGCIVCNGEGAPQPA